MELYIAEQLADLANATIKVKEIRRIRDVKKFANAEELKRQMTVDLKELEI